MRTVIKAIAGAVLLPVAAGFLLADVCEYTVGRIRRSARYRKSRKRRK